MRSVAENAYAKINLYLDILGKREDGFHEVLTIMQLITLHDEVYLELNASGKITLDVENTDLEVLPEKNLAYIAAVKFFDTINKKNKKKIKDGVNIRIIKHIPVASGMGGGSADAAAVLRGLNRLYDLPLTKNELCAIGAEIGSDVPFCIVGGVQICRGRGEELALDIFGIQHYYIVTASADKKISTADAYNKLDMLYGNFESHRIMEDYGIMVSDLISGRCRHAFTLMRNIFEDIYDEKTTSIGKIKEIMMNHSCKFAMLSGSGPTVYGVFPGGLYAEDAHTELARNGINAIISTPINLTYENMEGYEKPWKR